MPPIIAKVTIQKPKFIAIYLNDFCSNKALMPIMGNPTIIANNAPWNAPCLNVIYSAVP